MKWLHLSDLHYCPTKDGRSSRELRQRLPEYIREQGLKVDEIFITGDYRHAFIQKDDDINEGAEQSVQYIWEIADAAGIKDVQHIHIVPGNHDRDRLEENRHNTILKKYNSDSGRFDTDDFKELKESFAFFDCMCETLYGKEHIWAEHPLHTYCCIEGKYILLCLNTTVTHNSDASRGHLVIGNNDLALLFDEIKEKHKNLPIIVLGHHSLEYFRSDEKKVVERLFRQHPVELYLCGDAHTVWWRRINSHLEITTGCLKEGDGVQAVFGYGNFSKKEYTAYLWDSRFPGWEPYTPFNKDLGSSFLAGDASTPAKVVTITTPMMPSGLFRGRKTIVKQIQDKLQDSIKLVLVNGMGGIGKTEICRYLFQQCIDNGFAKFKQVGWLFFEKDIAHTMLGQFHDIPLDEPEIHIGNVTNYLNRQGKDLLLFIDNANELSRDDVAYLRRLQCSVILTSRSKIDQIHPVEVGRLEEKECRELYLETIGVTNQNADIESVDEIIKLADRHTLSVELLAKTQCAAGLAEQKLLDTLRSTGFNLQGITEEIESSYNLETQAGDENRYAVFIKHMAKVFDISGIDTEEGKILQLFSLFPGVSAPLQKVREWFGLENLNGINRLADKGWLNKTSAREASIHPIIASVIQYKFTPSLNDLENLAKMLAQSLVVKTGEIFTEKLDIFPIAVLVAEKLIHEPAQPEFFVLLYLAVGYICHSICDYSKALEWYQKALAISESVLGTAHPSTAITYNNIAGVHKAQGDYPKSLEWYQKASAIYESVLGTAHPSTATPYNNIAGVYEAQGDFPKSLEWYQKALAIRERVLGTNHPSTATTYNNIAGVHKAQGDYPKSLEWYQKALAICESVLGTDHPDTATTYNNIAGVHKAQSDYPKSLEWYQKALAIRERVLGADHPDTAITYNNIAGVHKAQGDYHKALEWYQKALKTLENRLGKEHPNTKIVSNNMMFLKEKMKKQ